ncbi:MAG: DUF1016 domain-containing protein [Endomicrobium sp.]|nr:DUF1016 domain-containing protein [Endomicrobium sp.]
MLESRQACKGFPFVASLAYQHRSRPLYNLVFYNYLLKCFVIIELKTTKSTHADIGQIDMSI